LFSRDVFEDSERIAQLCREVNALFIMNDRADFAALLGSGLHLGQDDLAPPDARKIMPPGSVVGFSTHNEEQLRSGDAEPVDYLAIGPIFATGSKEHPDPVVGHDRLRLLRRLPKKPLVAIGGITLQTAPHVLHTGADAVAVIGDLFPHSSTQLSLRSRAEEWVSLTSSHFTPDSE